MKIIRRKWRGLDRASTFTLYPLGDVHLGNVACDESLFRAVVNRIADDDRALWVGMGDYCDFINRTDPRFDPDSLPRWVKMSHLSDLAGAVAASYPGKPVIVQNSLNEQNIADWLRQIENGPEQSLRSLEEMDYDRYGAGEAELAWLNREIRFGVGRLNARQVIVDLLSTIERSIRSRKWAVGHLKFSIDDGNRQSKISFTSIPSLGRMSLNWV